MDETFLNQEITGGVDSRRLVDNPHQNPYQWCCSIQVSFPEPVIYTLGTLEEPGRKWREIPTTISGCGSGVLIGAGTVLTCAHVLMGAKMNHSSGPRGYNLIPVLADKVIVKFHKPGLGPLTYSFDPWSKAEIQLNPIFVHAFNDDHRSLTTDRVKRLIPYDYALIQLKPKVSSKVGRRVLPGHRYGWWSSKNRAFVDPAFNRKLAMNGNFKVEVCGYPGDKGDGNCSQLFHAKGSIVKNQLVNSRTGNDQLIYHLADTKAGMSGSPIWVTRLNGKRFLVGLHSTFGKSGKKILRVIM